MKADAVLNLRVPATMKDALARAADDNLRTMSSMATWAMAEWLSEHGYLDRQELSAARSTRKRSRS
jgi:hypothetical protein